MLYRAAHHEHARIAYISAPGSRSLLRGYIISPAQP